MPGSIGYTRKPDLAPIDKGTISHDEITCQWLSPKVIAEYTKETFQPASRLGKTMDTKAYLVLVDQPWRRFVLGLSIANGELRVHLYDHSGVAISGQEPASIGKIWVDDVYYDVIDILFSSTAGAGAVTHACDRFTQNLGRRVASSHDRNRARKTGGACFCDVA